MYEQYPVLINNSKQLYKSLTKYFCFPHAIFKDYLNLAIWVSYWNLGN